MLSKNSKIIAIKQAFAFTIDFFLVSFVLIVHPSLETYFVFVILWLLYIPMSEFYFSQTIGMKLMGTSIFNTLDSKKSMNLGTVMRRHIARIGMMWGVVGWAFMFVGKQYVADYIIVDKKHTSIESNEEGWVKVHKNNEYKVVFFVLALMFVLSFLKGVLYG